jgi:hypothetical protein
VRHIISSGLGPGRAWAILKAEKIQSRTGG